jgi:hypothetical protein
VGPRAIEVAEILQALLKQAQIRRFFFGTSRVPQKADSGDSFALHEAIGESRVHHHLGSLSKAGNT